MGSVEETTEDFEPTARVGVKVAESPDSLTSNPLVLRSYGYKGYKLNDSAFLHKDLKDVSGCERN